LQTRLNSRPLPSPSILVFPTNNRRPRPNLNLCSVPEFVKTSNITHSGPVKLHYNLYSRKHSTMALPKHSLRSPVCQHRRGEKEHPPIKLCMLGTAQHHGDRLQFRTVHSCQNFCRESALGLLFIAGITENSTLSAICFDRQDLVE